MTLVNEPHECHMSNGVHICVLGLIGAGKSSLTHALETAMPNALGLYEPASKTNPYLSDYYANPERWAFEIQIFLLSKRFEQQMLAQSMTLTGKNIVQDSSIFSDSVFVEMLKKSKTMATRDVDCYFRLFQNMSRFIMYPSAIVYLDTSVETSLERIAKRMSEKAGRKCEAGIDPEYLYALKAELDKLITSLERYTHVIKLDWNKERTNNEILEEAKNIYDTVLMLKQSVPMHSCIGI